MLQAAKALPVRKVTFPSGHKYIGQISNGTMNGLGIYAFDGTQARYEGEVHSSPTCIAELFMTIKAAHTDGCYLFFEFQSGSTRLGAPCQFEVCECFSINAQFLDGAFEGLGAETFVDGMYVGAFHAGLRHGLGTSTNPCPVLSGGSPTCSSVHPYTATPVDQG